METIIVLGGVELNEQYGDGKSGSNHDKKDLTSQSTINNSSSSNNNNHIHTFANNSLNIDSAKTSLQQHERITGFQGQTASYHPGIGSRSIGVALQGERRTRRITRRGRQGKNVLQDFLRLSHTGCCSSC